MGTISQTGRQDGESIWPTQMTLDEWTQPEFENVANHHKDTDKKFGTATVIIPAVAMLEIDNVAPEIAQATFRQLIETVDIISGKLQIAQGSSQPGSSHLCSSLCKLESLKSSMTFPPDEGPH
jgi:hypothetical protein